MDKKIRKLESPNLSYYHLCSYFTGVEAFWWLVYLVIFKLQFFFLKKIPQPKKDVLIFFLMYWFLFLQQKKILRVLMWDYLRVCVVFIADFSWRHHRTSWATRVSWSPRISRGSWCSWKSWFCSRKTRQPGTNWAAWSARTAGTSRIRW